jgi:N-acetylmuramoyl-L-alanine amidase
MRFICRLLLSTLLFSFSCVAQAQHAFSTHPGQPLPRQGDEIMVCGQFFHTGAPVVLWFDYGGYDGYRPPPRAMAAVPATAPATTMATTAPAPAAGRRGRGFGGGRPGGQAPAYTFRYGVLSDEEMERIKNGNWPIDLLRDKIDQFVVHYDVAGLSRTCYTVLRDRNLGVQFMLDIDGTIYQTVDLKDACAHATKANSRSVGIEIANMGAYSPSSSLAPLKQWYSKDSTGRVRLTVPERLGDGGVRTPHFVGHPARNELVEGIVQGNTYRQYDYTPEQYNSLIHLTATLCTVFPKITCDYPRQKSALGTPALAPTTQWADGDPTTRPAALASPTETGLLIPHQLTHDQYEDYQGVLGHYHVQDNKEDPGPAFQWDRVINSARGLMTSEAKIANLRARNHPVRSRRSTTQPTTQPSNVATTEPAPEL